MRYGKKRRTRGPTVPKAAGLVGGVLVGLVVLDEAVDAECGDDAHGGDYDILDDFAHKKLLKLFLALKYFFFDEKQVYFYN